MFTMRIRHTESEIIIFAAIIATVMLHAHSTTINIWDEKTGLWSAFGGCSLPEENMSLVALSCRLTADS